MPEANVSTDVAVPLPKTGDYWFAPRSGFRALLELRPDEDWWRVSLYRVGRDGKPDLRTAAGCAGKFTDPAWFALAVMAGAAELVDFG